MVSGSDPLNRNHCRLEHLKPDGEKVRDDVPAFLLWISFACASWSKSSNLQLASELNRGFIGTNIRLNMHR